MTRKIFFAVLFLMGIGLQAKPLLFREGPTSLRLSLDYRLMYLGLSELPVLSPDLKAYELPWENEALHRVNLGFALIRHFGKRTSAFNTFGVFFDADLLNGPITSPPGERQVLHLSWDPRDDNYGLSFCSWSLRKAFVMVAGMRAAIVMGRMQPDFGMGILASKRKSPFFGYSNYGDLTDRVAFKLFMGDWVSLRDPRQFFIGAGFDRVSRDVLADTSKDDRAYQAFGVLGLSNKHMGGEAAYIYRWQTNRDGDHIRLHILDFTAHGHVAWKGGDFTAKAEYVWVRGHSDVARLPANSEGYKVQTKAFAALAKVRQRMFSFRIETGLAPGDPNPYDSEFNAFTFNPEHQVGLIAFSEVLKDLTAAGAHNMTDPTYLAHAPSGYTALPSNGGITDALYLYPGISIKPWEFLDFRTAVLFAWADKPLYDPYATDLHGGVLTSPLGGKAGNYIGTEYDLGLFAALDLDKRGPRLKAFAQFGIFFPGSALRLRGDQTFKSIKLVTTGIQFQW